jgi:hypothetical protein
MLNGVTKCAVMESDQHCYTNNMIEFGIRRQMMRLFAILCAELLEFLVQDGISFQNAFI